MSLTLWSFWQRFRVMYRRPTSQSQGITDGILLGAEGNALSSHLLPRKKQRATIGGSSGEARGPRASSFAQGFGGQVKRILLLVHRSFSGGGSAPDVKRR
jgi:hypothetical protein